jgi:hypothetical protein
LQYEEKCGASYKNTKVTTKKRDKGYLKKYGVYG